MKAHTTLLLAAALCAALPAVAVSPAALPQPAASPALFGERESPFRKGYGMPVIVRAGENAPASPIFITSRFEQDEAAFAAALPQAYFLHWRKEEGEHARIPAQLRHVTVGDVLQHWEQYSLFARSRFAELNRADFARRDPQEVLEHVWMCQPPPVLCGEEENLRLTIPGLGGRGKETGALRDLVAGVISLPYDNRWFRVEKPEPGRYTLFLHTSLLMDAAALEDALLAAKAYVVPVAEADKLRNMKQMRPLARQEDGSWAGEGVRLRFNREASEAFACERTLPGGRQVRGYSQLIFDVEQSGDTPLHLYTSLYVPSVYGREGIRNSHPEGSTPLFQADLSQARAAAPPREPRPAAAPPAGDLALVQFPIKRSLVAYACRLSDSSPLPQAELQLIDANGQVVTTYAVKDGIAQGDISMGDYRLRLVCGEEVLEQPVNWGGYEGKPHPHAPDHDARWTRGDVFTDRRVYAPGDTVHLYGFVREFRDKKLHFPQNLRAELRYRLPEADGSMKQHCQPLEVAADGSFMGSFKLADNMQGIRQMSAHLCWLGRSSAQGVGIRIQENPVPALRLDGGFHLQGGELRAEARVRTVDGAPLGGRGLRWEFLCKPLNPVWPDAEGYCFGDHRPDAPLPEKCRQRRDQSILLQSRSGLDAEGRTEVRFGLPRSPFPRRWEAELVADCGYAYTENGMRCEERFTLDPASLYVGLRRESCLSPVGGRLSLSLLLVDNRGQRYAGEPVEVELRAELRRVVPGRFGEGLRLNPMREEIVCRKLAIPAGGCAVELPLSEEGVYDIVVRGRDAAGKEFASAIRQYVWSRGETAPWVASYPATFTPEADKRSYRLGDTARILVPGEVEGEAFIMVQGHDSCRFLRQAVRAGSRWLHIPLLEEDGPAPTVEVVLVQGRNLLPRNGVPALLRGSCRLSVENKVQQRLRVQLDELPESLPGGASCEVSGCVRDAEGNPVPHATVFVCAQDVGVTASFTGLDRPELSVQEQGDEAMSRAVIGVRELPGLPQPRYHARWHYGQGEGIDLAQAELPATCNSPLVQRVKADAEGRFRACLTLPQGLADYQIVAQALGQTPLQHGADGALLRAEAPLSLRTEDLPPCARVGDVLELPLLLRCSSLPQGAPERPRWRLAAVEQSGAESLQAAQELELGAGEILRVRVPVRLTAAGTARLRWRLSAVEGQVPLENMSAELNASLPVVAVETAADEPRLTRRYERRTDVGQWEPSTCFQQGDIVRITIEMEGRLLESAQTAIHDHLPTGWLPVLHKFTDNCAADWMPDAIMACHHQSGWGGGQFDHSPRFENGRLTMPRAHKGCPLRLCYLARVTCRGEFTAPPARVEGALEAASPATRVVVE